MNEIRTTPIEQLLVAVASPDRHEDSAERKEAWDEIKRREAERKSFQAALAEYEPPCGCTAIKCHRPSCPHSDYDR